MPLLLGILRIEQRRTIDCIVKPDELWVIWDMIWISDLTVRRINSLMCCH